MNIFELESFNLADAVKFHSRLNHRLWDSAEHLHPQVKERLLQVARDFQEFLGVPDLDVKDITVSGSNAAYNYTDHSDIDLHLVVDIPDVVHNEVYRELFNAKKYQYNDQHNIRIGGADVELYAQPSDQPHHSQGIYSLLRNAWIQVPRRKRSSIDDTCVQAKFEDLAARVDDAVDSGDVDRLRSLQQKIKTMRQTGLEQQGEFGCDNLAFKLLRARGYIQRLIDARNQAHAAALSLAEKNAPMAPVIYGFMTESPDGVDPSTKMFLEQPVDESDIDSVLARFFDNCIDFLEIENAPEMVLHHNTDWSESTGSFGQFNPDNNVLHLATSGRHVLDILRTMAHELTHCKQNEKHTLPDNAGETGSWWEDEANAVAGRIMRHWADEHPEMFKDVSLEESASGYIPKNKKEARDPRYSMAVSVDIKPGQVGKEANKLALNTGRNGEPQLLMKSANLRENRMPHPSQGPQLSTVLQWPEVVNKINSAMKATGWKGQRQSDDAFMFSTKGQLDDEFYMVIIENAGEGFFTYALGTVEEGDPYIDDAYKGRLPNTEASVSELINDIRDGFGLNEQGVAEGSSLVDRVQQIIEKNHQDGVWTGQDLVEFIQDTYDGRIPDEEEFYDDIDALEYEDNFFNELVQVGAFKQSVAENFADGRNPQDKGDSKRHGINTKASVSSLRKTAKSGGRKGQLAHWLANMKSGRAKAKRKNESIAEVRINNASGVGAVPYNADVDYFGLQVQMRPSMFLKLALPMDPHDPEERKAIAFCKGELNERGFGAPFLNVSVPEAWEQGDFSLEARVKGHDGRHRCHAILEKEGDDAVEMHIFIAHTRRRDISDEMIENLRNGILNQLGQFVRGPIFGEAK